MQQKNPRESIIEKYAVKRVRAVGGDIRKLRWVGRRGAPDRLILLPDGMVFVEFKRKRKNAQGAQAREHELLAKYGADVRVLDTKDKVDDLLSDFGYP